MSRLGALGALKAALCSPLATAFVALSIGLYGGYGAGLRAAQTPKVEAMLYEPMAVQALASGACAIATEKAAVSIDEMLAAVSAAEEEPAVEQEAMSEAEPEAEPEVEPEQPAPAYSFWQFDADDVLHRYADLYAHDSGLVNEYEPGYYAMHRNTPFGDMVMAMREGDHVAIDGHELIVVGFDSTYTGEDVSEIREHRVGKSTACFQTCYYPGSDESLIVVCEHADGSKPDYWNTMVVYGTGGLTFEQVYGWEAI